MSPAPKIKKVAGPKRTPHLHERKCPRCSKGKLAPTDETSTVTGERNRVWKCGAKRCDYIEHRPE